MKDLFSYLNENDFLNEGRRPGSKNKPKQPTPEVDGGTVYKTDDGKNMMVPDDTAVVAGKKVNVDVDKMEGKPANSNGSKGTFAIDAPTDDDIKSYDDVDWEKAAIQKQMLRSCMDQELDFFIQGRAGWGKTSVIKDTAKKCGYHIVTVYLDKAQATDLEGIPVAVKAEDRRGGVNEARALPAWVQVLLENPDKKWLLFFDEMNQATPDVQSALMPIVLEHTICNIKFDNFFVGAAGNYMSENPGALSELGGPLEQRFQIFDWTSGSQEEDWEDAIEHLASKYKLKFNDDLFDSLTAVAPYFGSPRNVERYLLNWVLNLNNLDEKKKKMYTPKLMKMQLDITFKKAENDRARMSEQLEGEMANPTKRNEKFEELADEMYAFIHKNEKKAEESNTRKRNSSVGTIKSDEVQSILDHLEIGRIDVDRKAYGLSLENWHKCLGKEEGDEVVPYTAEEVDWFNNVFFPKSGRKAKFTKDSDFNGAYSNPKELGIDPETGCYNT